MPNLIVPSYVRCGSTVAQVYRHRDLAKRFKYNGFYSRQDGVLLIADDAPPNLQQNAFLHECIHLVWQEYGNPEHDEGYVLRAANGLIQILGFEMDGKFDFSQLELVESVVRWNEKDYPEESAVEYILPLVTVEIPRSPCCDCEECDECADCDDLSFMTETCYELSEGEDA